MKRAPIRVYALLIALIIALLVTLAWLAPGTSHAASPGGTLALEMPEALQEEALASFLAGPGQT